MPCIFPYINYRNIYVCKYSEFSLTSIFVTMLYIFSPHSIVVKYYIVFCNFYSSILCLLQSQTTTNQKNTMWSSDNINDHNNTNKRVQISISSHFPDVIKFPQVVSLNPLFVMMGNVSLGYRYCKIIHSYS